MIAVVMRASVPFLPRRKFEANATQYRPRPEVNWPAMRRFACLRRTPTSVGIVNNAIENCVGQRRIADDVRSVPAGQPCAAAPISAIGFEVREVALE